MNTHIRSLAYRLLTATALVTLPALTLAENLVVEGPDKQVTLSQQALLALDHDPLTTETPWTDGELRFDGAPLAAVLALADIDSGQLVAQALNGYSVDIPVSAALDSEAFIAVRINGEIMRVKDKGPFWIVFPWSEKPGLLNREVRAWSIWQLTALKAAP